MTPAGLPPILTRLGIAPAHYLKTQRRHHHAFGIAMGCVDSLRRTAHNLGQRYIRGMTKARRLFPMRPSRTPITLPASPVSPAASESLRPAVKDTHHSTSFPGLACRFGESVPVSSALDNRARKVFGYCTYNQHGCCI